MTACAQLDGDVSVRDVPQRAAAKALPATDDGCRPSAKHHDVGLFHIRES